MPNIWGFWFQKPYSSWCLGPESFNIGYVDPLGMDSRVIFRTDMGFNIGILLRSLLRSAKRIIHRPQSYSVVTRLRPLHVIGQLPAALGIAFML